MNDLETVLRDLLTERKGFWADITEATNVSHSWLSKFVNGHIPNPGYGTMKKVHEHLTSPARRKKAATQ